MVRLLIPLDDRVGAARAQAEAVAEMAEITDGVEVYLLHVFGDSPSGASVSQLESVREASERLEEAGLEVELLESSGHPSEEILSHAEEYDVDQIVVAGRKRTPAGKALFGSVTQEVILGTNRPVLVCGSLGEP